MIINVLKRAVLTALIITTALVQCSYAGTDIRFCGGPSGGTFMFYANAVSNLMRKNYASVTAVPTHGSVDNIRMVDSGQAEFGLAYSGDVYKAAHGLLPGDSTKYKNIRAVGFLYKAPLQLIVLKSSGIRTLADLKGKRVAIGEEGSGSAVSATDILKAAGIDQSVIKYYVGYRAAMPILKNKTIDAVWACAGTPTPAIYEMAAQTDIRIVPIKQISGTNNFSPYTITAGTYKGTNAPVSTIAESAIWITNVNTGFDAVKFLMSSIYSRTGIKWLKSQHPSAASLTAENGLTGISIPLHPAAEEYWKAHNIKQK